MSSLSPRKAYSAKELQELYPSHLKLQQVQIFLRHGERTPTSARFEHVGLAAFWPYCSAAKHLLSVTLNSSSGWSASQWTRHLETFGADDNPVVVAGPQGEIDPMCNIGELTDQGRRSSYALGTRLRHLYIDQLRFLPATVKDPETIYLRATRIPRALESLQEAFGGLYPPHWRSESFPTPAIVLRAAADETLNPNNGYCKRFAELAQAFGRRSATKWNASSEMDYINNLIGSWMPETSKRVAIDSQPRLSGILDTIYSTLAHGPETKLPKDFYDHKSVSIMDRLVREEWFSGYNESREYRALGIGSLMGDIVSRMIVSVENTSQEEIIEVEESGEKPLRSQDKKTAVKLGLSGCHDTTIASMLTSLGAFTTGSWPQYTSHVAVELFKKTNTPEGDAPKVWKVDKSPVTGASDGYNKVSTSFRQSLGLNSKTPVDKLGEVNIPSANTRKKFDTLPESERAKLDGYYVRIRYNDEPITIPGCKVPGKHLDGNVSFCTLEAFKTIVDKFTPLNWKQECRSSLNHPAFPTKPEPAGY